MLKENTLRKYSSDDVANYLLRCIWGFYDVGGISMHRSLKSALLEKAMALLRISGNNQQEEIPERDPFSIITELSKRKSKSSQGSLFSPAYMQHKDVAALLLEELLGACKKCDFDKSKEAGMRDADAKKCKGFDTRGLEQILRIIPVPYNRGKISCEELLKEAEDRIYEKSKREYEESV